MGKQARQRTFEQDQKTGLSLPQSYYDAKRLLWFEDLIKALSKAHVPHRITENGNGLVVGSKKGVWYEAEVQATQLLPIPTLVGMWKQWSEGLVEHDAVYRIMSPSEQIRFSNRFKLKPNSTDGGDAQKWLDLELKKREDLRRQGFDPVKEGLN